MCGCPPARTHVVIAGHVQDAANAPVAGARVEFDAVRVSRDTLPFRSETGSTEATTTDTAGVFRSRVFSLSGPEQYHMRLRVIRNPSRETTMISIGRVRFVFDRERPDSIFVPLRIP